MLMLKLSLSYFSTVSSHVAVAELKKKAGTVACSFPGAW
jgi:hypothetical protein